jgi:hypothetical protein
LPRSEAILAYAGVAKLAIRGRLKIGCPRSGACGFESRPRHSYSPARNLYFDGIFAGGFPTTIAISSCGCST